MDVEKQSSSKRDWRQRFHPFGGGGVGLVVLSGMTCLAVLNIYEAAVNGRIFGRRGRISNLDDDPIGFVLGISWDLLVLAAMAYVVIRAILFVMRKLAVWLGISRPHAVEETGADPERSKTKDTSA